MPYTYSHPRPLVTVDVVLFSKDGPSIVLIRRKREPFKGRFALPGGFVEMDEPLEEAARREIYEETGVKDVPLFQCGTFGNPSRDPRGRVITIAFAGVLDAPLPLRPADDAAEAEWFLLTSLPNLAFDHSEIVEKALEIARSKGLLE